MTKKIAESLVTVRQQTENRRGIDDCGLENIIPRIVSYQIRVNLLIFTL
jgi:hypothetical protein